MRERESTGEKEKESERGREGGGAWRRTGTDRPPPLQSRLSGSSNCSLSLTRSEKNQAIPAKRFLSLCTSSKQQQLAPPLFIKGEKEKLRSPGCRAHQLTPQIPGRGKTHPFILFTASLIMRCQFGEWICPSVVVIFDCVRSVNVPALRQYAISVFINLREGEREQERMWGVRDRERGKDKSGRERAKKKECERESEREGEKLRKDRRGRGG